MRKKVVGLLALYQILQVNAWSAAGHKAVAEIAFNLMDKAKSTDFVRRTLQLPETADLKAEMMSKSVWADTLRNDPNLKHTTKFHYLSMPPTRECKTVAFSDCGKGCIISAIGEYTMEAIDHGLNGEDREQALKFVLHLMADIAIPVHVGFRKDKGGNNIAINMPGKKKEIDADSGDDDGDSPPGFNLHGIWDKYLPRNANLATTVAEIYPPQRDHIFDSVTVKDINFRSMVDVATRMADETHSIACKLAYRHTDGSLIRSGDKLEPEYWTSRSEVAKRQIQRAGIRLAKLIDLMAVADGRINNNLSKNNNLIKNNNPPSGSSANVSWLLFVCFWTMFVFMN